MKNAFAQESPKSKTLRPFCDQPRNSMRQPLPPVERFMATSLSKVIDTGSEGTPAVRPVTVLLVDDQMIVGESVRRMLADEPDIQFHFCQDPSRAIETADAVAPTVILQDLVM